MRIALLTVNVYDNYGNTLQKYALYRTLEKFADRVEVFWHHGTKQFTPYDLELSPSFVGNVRASAFKCVRESKFKEFDDTHMRTRFDLPDLADVADEYDFFVVGSDQVWNPDLCVPGNFLEFAPPEKRIAYAASIAVPQLPANLVDYYREKISEMPYVSIREAEGVELVEKLTGKRPLRVLDPVFLLDADEWREIAKQPLWLNRKTYENGYLLSYFFDGKPPEQVYALADKLGLPVVNLLDLNNFDQYVTGIEEFLYLVDHATLMCTQSFHGTAFAINFKTPVIVYKVQIGRMMQRFSRLESLLALFGLSDRATDVDLEIKMDDPLQIDFTRRDEAIIAERTKALTFLKVALGLLPKEDLPIKSPVEPAQEVESVTEEPAQDESSEVVLDESSQDESSEVALDESPEDESSEVALDKSPEDESSEVALDKSPEDESSEVALDESPEDESSEVALDESPEDELSEVVLDESPEDELSEVALDKSPEDESSEVALDESSETESSEVALDESPEDESSEVALDKSPEDESSEVVLDESPEDESSEVVLDESSKVESPEVKSNEN